MTPEELREWYINDIESKQIVIDDLQAQLSAKEQECEELKRINSEYKQLLDPILDWGQTEGLEHGLKLGESITKTVLNRAKEYGQLRVELDEANLMIENVKQGREYFKKHLRDKEQECEELKSSLSASERFRASDAASALDEQNNLRAENERLKEEILSERAFTWELTSLRDENDRLKKIVLSDKETHDRAEYSLRKRCEDLEAIIKDFENRPLNLTQ